MKSSLVGLVAALTLSTSAFAADLYQPVAPLEPAAAPEVTVSESSGWYLRGDVGYSLNDMRGAKFLQGSNALMADFASTDLKGSALLGVGVGYQVTNYLRTDVTFDHTFKSDFKGSTTGTCNPGGGVTACTSNDISSMQAYSLMANAYVDLGTYASITPYVGAGIGGAYVKWDNLKNTACANNGTGCTPTDTHGGQADWRFAYALMAGASYDLTCNLKADAGYRYRHITGGNMFGYVNNGGPGFDKGIDQHEFRIGARYSFNGCSAQAYEPSVVPPAPPMVYK